MWFPELAAAAPIGHSVDTFWTWPQPAEGLWHIEQDVTVESVTMNAEYFWAEHVWWVEGYSLGGYVGLQSRGLRRADNSIGDTAIFSVWQAIDARGPACGRFVEITTGYSCSIAYPWRRGAKYRYVLERTTGDDTETWWAASIVDVERGTRSEIGEIKMRAPAGGIESTANFTEYFGGQEHSCASQPYSRAHFAVPRAPNGVVPPDHSSEVSDPDCRVTDSPDGGVTHEVGDPSLAPPSNDPDHSGHAEERPADGGTKEGEPMRPPDESAATPVPDGGQSASPGVDSGDEPAVARALVTNDPSNPIVDTTVEPRPIPPTSAPVGPRADAGRPTTASNRSAAASGPAATAESTEGQLAWWLRATASTILIAVSIGLFARPSIRRSTRGGPGGELDQPRHSFRRVGRAMGQTGPRGKPFE